MGYKPRSSGGGGGATSLPTWTFTSESMDTGKMTTDNSVIQFTAVINLSASVAGGPVIFNGQVAPGSILVIASQGHIAKFRLTSVGDTDPAFVQISVNFLFSSFGSGATWNGDYTMEIEPGNTIAASQVAVGQFTDGMEAVTKAPADNSTCIATTEYADAAAISAAQLPQWIFENTGSDPSGPGRFTLNGQNLKLHSTTAGGQEVSTSISAWSQFTFLYFSCPATNTVGIFQVQGAPDSSGSIYSFTGGIVTGAGFTSFDGRVCSLSVDSSAAVNAAMTIAANASGAIEPVATNMITPDTGWVANGDDGDKTSVIPDDTTILGMQAALNGVVPGFGDAFLAVTDKVKAMQAALANGFRPNA